MKQDDTSNVKPAKITWPNPAITVVQNNRDAYDMARLINHVAQNGGRLEMTRDELAVFRADTTRCYVLERMHNRWFPEALMISAQHGQAVDLFVAATQIRVEQGDETCLNGLRDMVQLGPSIETRATLADVIAPSRVTGRETTPAERLAALTQAEDWRAYLRTLVRNKKRDRRNPEPMVLNEEPIKSLDGLIQRKKERGIDPRLALEQIEARSLGRLRFGNHLASRLDYEWLERELAGLGLAKEFRDFIEGKTIEEMGGDTPYRRLHKGLHGLRGPYKQLGGKQLDANAPSNAPSLSPQPDIYYGTRYRDDPFFDLIREIGYMCIRRPRKTKVLKSVKPIRESPSGSPLQ